MYIYIHLVCNEERTYYHFENTGKVQFMNNRECHLNTNELWVVWCKFNNRINEHQSQCGGRLYYVRVHLRLLKAFHNLQTEHDMETKPISIDFSHHVAEGFSSQSLQTLNSQLINHSPYVRYQYANHKYYILHDVS